jgi:GNAT superfamily N-acetyltransferase
MFDYDVRLDDAITYSTEYILPVVKVREITNIKEKRKWMEYFTKGYSGSLIGLQPQMFGEICRFYVASVDGKDAGFIRITNYTETWSKYYESEVWNASDAYVKKPYRSSGVLRKLLEYVIENCNVVSVRLETERLNRYSRYYKTLGFTYAWSFDNGELCIAVIEKLKDAAIQRNKEFNDKK